MLTKNIKVQVSTKIANIYFLFIIKTYTTELPHICMRTSISSILSVTMVSNISMLRNLRVGIKKTYRLFFVKGGSTQVYKLKLEKYGFLVFTFQRVQIAEYLKRKIKKQFFLQILSQRLYFTINIIYTSMSYLSMFQLRLSDFQAFLSGMNFERKASSKLVFLIGLKFIK